MLEDDPYGLDPLRGRVAAVDLRSLAARRSIYTSSFSKTIAPGLRVGWYVLPNDLAGDLDERANSTYITPALLGQAAVYEFVRRGNFEPNLVRVNGAARRRGATR